MPIDRQARRPSSRARRRSPIRWTYNALADTRRHRRQPDDRRRRPQDRPLRRHLRPGHQQVSRRTRTPPSCGWSTCTPTRASCSGSRATATRSATTTWSKRGVVPADLAAKLPDTTGAVFPTPAQLDTATKLITEGWDTTVGANVVKPPESGSRTTARRQRCRDRDHASGARLRRAPLDALSWAGSGSCRSSSSPSCSWACP